MPWSWLSSSYRKFSNSGIPITLLAGEVMGTTGYIKYKKTNEKRWRSYSNRDEISGHVHWVLLNDVTHLLLYLRYIYIYTYINIYICVTFWHIWLAWCITLFPERCPINPWHIIIDHTCMCLSHLFKSKFKRTLLHPVQIIYSVHNKNWNILSGIPVNK